MGLFWKDAPMNAVQDSSVPPLRFFYERSLLSETESRWRLNTWNETAFLFFVVKCRQKELSFWRFYCLSPKAASKLGFVVCSSPIKRAFLVYSTFAKLYSRGRWNGCFLKKHKYCITCKSSPNHDKMDIFANMTPRLKKLFAALLQTKWKSDVFHCYLITTLVRACPIIGQHRIKKMPKKRCFFSLRVTL